MGCGQMLTLKIDHTRISALSVFIINKLIVDGVGSDFNVENLPYM